jgi:acetyltransferase-like isoleucine patch superfamily enzyme
MHSMELGAIHPTALISPAATIGAGVTVGAYAIVHDGVRVGDHSVVGAHCILGEPLAASYEDAAYENPPLVIGPRAMIRSGSILYAGSTLGERFECGHRVTVREAAQIGAHCRVGTLSDIQGHCAIGDYVRLHSNVHVGQQSRIGDFVWIFPYTVLTNDPHPPSNTLVGVTVEDFAVIATMCVVLPGVTVGENALVGASTMVRSDVAPRAVVVGNPGKQVTTIDAVKDRFTGGPVYPWAEHFERGMPWAGVGYAAWDAARRRTPGDAPRA